MGSISVGNEAVILSFKVIFSLTLISKAHKEAQLVILTKKKITELDRRDTAQLTLNSPFLLQLYILLNVKYENLGLYYITSSG